MTTTRARARNLAGRGSRLRKPITPATRAVLDNALAELRDAVLHPPKPRTPAQRADLTRDLETAIDAVLAVTGQTRADIDYSSQPPPAPAATNAPGCPCLSASPRVSGT